MKFVCLGFIEESKWESLSEEEGQRIMDDCFEYDDQLRREGHFIGGEALKSARDAVTLRFKNGSVDVTDGPYAETKEMLGGILLLEARDLNHAIALMSQHPGVKVGPFEIRPADAEMNKLIAERDARYGGQEVKPGQLALAADVIRAALQFCYEWIKPLAQDLSDSPMTPPTPDGGNHPMWVMGHLVFSSAALIEMIDGRSHQYADWKQLFNGGTQPLSDGGVYPDYAEILQAYESEHQKRLELLTELGDNRLNDRPAAVWPDLQDDPDFQTNGKLFHFIAMHEMSHRGQLADVRRVLGRKPFV